MKAFEFSIVSIILLLATKPQLFKSWIAILTGEITIQRISARETNYAIQCIVIYLAPVVQTLDSSIYRINHYPADKYYGNQLRYPADSDLSGG